MQNQSTSPFDAAVPANCPATDQRGYARIVGGTIDIGAVEMSGLAPFSSGGASKHKPKPSKKPPSWTPIHVPAKTPAWTAMMHKRGMPTPAQVAQQGKVALPDLGIRLRSSATELVDPTGLDLTL